MLRQRSRAATLIATTHRASPARVRRLARAGAEIVVVEERGAHVSLPALFRRLAERGVVSVLIEGGGELAAAALRARLVDRLLVVSAPTVLGGDGRAMLGPLDLRRLGDAPRLVDEKITRLGPDLLREGTAPQRGRTLPGERPVRRNVPASIGPPRRGESRTPLLPRADQARREGRGRHNRRCRAEGRSVRRRACAILDGQRGRGAEGRKATEVGGGAVCCQSAHLCVPSAPPPLCPSAPS